MPYYTPVVLAKQLATLDRVSGGRLDVGLGLGWSRDEYDAVGVPYANRGRRADEFLACLKAIWTEDPVEFRGEFYRVPRASVRPRPLQAPTRRSPSGAGAVAVRRAVAFGDGFNGGNMPLDRVAPLVKELRTPRSSWRVPRLRWSCGTFHPSDASRANRRLLFGRSTRSATTSGATPSSG
jgi:alkanesulfonate monooxygenase SsuD/methylene tetrahydromethanopterin reductase-like flavin-dependent oxidoreductase (luciferase family)